MTKKIELGFEGENLAKEYLIQKGFKILAQNYKTKQGEVDIIATKDDVLAFVEVKLRVNPQFYLSELITPYKQKKIILAALHYIAREKLYDYIFRFDVALIEGQNREISYILNAFTKEF